MEDLADFCPVSLVDFPGKWGSLQRTFGQKMYFVFDYEATYEKKHPGPS